MSSQPTRVARVSPFNLREWRGRSHFLLLSLLALILLYPFVPAGRIAGYLVLGINSAVLVAAVYAVAEDRKRTIVALALAIPQVLLATFGLLAVDGSRLERILALADTFVLAVFYCYVIAQVVEHISKSARVNADIIFSGLSVYLLLGLLWSSIYAVLEVLSPGSFHTTLDMHQHGGVELIYFSFVTMTTLGYGDITPLTSRARSFAIVQTVIGQLYLAVMIAWLVSRYKRDDKTGS